MNKVSKIETQKNNAQRVNVYIDGEYAFSCHLETALKNKLNQGDEVEPLKLKAIVQEDNYLKCKSCALRIIERGAKSEKEMLDKLQGKGYDVVVANKVIDFMKDYGFVNDEKLAKAYITQKSKSEGPGKIKSFLYKKGIPQDIINKNIIIIDEEMEEKTAFNLAVKKYSVLAVTEKDTKKLYKKTGDYLLRKGYSYEICRSVLKNVVSEWDGE